MILSPGATFGPYQIVGPLGAGGMGEVYRAHDPRLKRDVALKVLAGEPADLQQVQRFHQEARAASSLNHPNIVVVHDVGEAAPDPRSLPVPYLTMELLDGESLESIVARGSMPLKRLLNIAAQVADGLARAHESGIVHRDLKPSNVIVTPDGRAKVLDFGLAKLHVETTKSSERLRTVPGTIIGTVGYMSPEQARGDAVTAASDQFALGCILYRMITGREAFVKRSMVETLSAILRDEPQPIAELAPSTPTQLRWCVERCLSKDVAGRYAATRDLAHDLKAMSVRFVDTRAGWSSRRLVVPAMKRRRKLRAALVAAALLLAGAGAAFVANRFREPPPALSFQRLTLRRGVVTRGLFLPDSGWVLYTASWEGLPARTYMTLPESAGIDRELDADAQLPLAYSADGTQVLVLLGPSRFSYRPHGTLAWWPIQGGKPRPILEDAGWADWAKRGAFLAVVRTAGRGQALEIRGPEGEMQRKLFQTRGTISCVRLSPDETHVAFIHHPDRDEESGEVMLAAVEGGAPRTLTPRFARCAGLDWNVPRGEIWFTAATGMERSTFLWGARASGELRALQALPDSFVLQHVSKAGDRALLSSRTDESDLIVRRRGQPARELTWFGSSVVTDVSPDGSAVLFQDAGPTDRSSGTWLRPIAGEDAVRIGDALSARFSPDGSTIIGVAQSADGSRQLVLMPVGEGSTRALTSPPGNPRTPSFANATTLLYARSQNDTSEVHRIEVDGTGDRSLGAEGCEQPVANPAATRFLCLDDEARSLAAFPMEKGPGRKLFGVAPPASLRYARWSADGTRIFAVSSDRRLLTLSAADGSLVSEETLDDTGPSAAGGTILSAAVSADGSVQAYSVARSSSSLYLASGLH